MLLLSSTTPSLALTTPPIFKIELKTKLKCPPPTTHQYCRQNCWLEVDLVELLIWAKILIHTFRVTYWVPKFFPSKVKSSCLVRLHNAFCFKCGEILSETSSIELKAVLLSSQKLVNTVIGNLGQVRFVFPTSFVRKKVLCHLLKHVHFGEKGKRKATCACSLLRKDRKWQFTVDGNGSIIYWKLNSCPWECKSHFSFKFL